MMKNKLMKKIVPALFAMGLVVTTSTNAFAAGNGTVTDVNTNNTANVDVLAKIATTGAKVYKLDVEWGNMEFVYSDASTWNPDTHLSTGAAGWQTTNTYYGDNNTLTVTNHSNAEVKVKYDYTKDGGATGFNGVNGFFFADQTDAVNAAQGTLANQITDTKIDTAVGTAVGSAPKKSVYFSLNGTPDKATGAQTFTKVGAITLTITQP